MSYSQYLSELKKKTAKQLQKRNLSFKDFDKICEQTASNSRRFFFVWLNLYSERKGLRDSDRQWCLENCLDLLMTAQCQRFFAEGKHRIYYNCELDNKLVAIIKPYGEN